MLKKKLILGGLALATVLAAYASHARTTRSRFFRRAAVRADATAIDRHFSPTEWLNSEQGKAEDPERIAGERQKTDYSTYAYSREFTIPVAFENLNLDIFCDVETQNKLNLSTVFTPDGEGAYDGLFQKKILIKKVKVTMKSIWECQKKEAGQDASVADFTFKQELYDYSEYTNHGYTVYKFIANGATTKVIYSGHIVIRKNSYASNQKKAMPDGTEEKLAFLKKALPEVLKK